MILFIDLSPEIQDMMSIVIIHFFGSFMARKWAWQPAGYQLLCLNCNFKDDPPPPKTSNDTAASVLLWLCCASGSAVQFHLVCFCSSGP